MALRSLSYGVLSLVTALAAVGVPMPGSATASAVTVEVQHDDLLLPRASHGPAAVAELGADLATAARRNGTTASALRALLLTDSSAWVSPTGRVFYVDPIPSSPRPAGSVRPADAAPYPTSQTFLLHSNPSSKRTIYLDFDGAQVSGTAWNSGSRPLPNGTYDGYDPAGNGPGFTQAEHDSMQSIWERVAEDYAPFDVDVTTEDPGPAAIERTSGSDDTYGTRALITSDDVPGQVLCDNACGGVAFLDVFDTTFSHSAYQPAWVFAPLLSDDTKAIAEATSHEVGHNMGLDHDGLGGDDYYLGHGGWAPVMGAGFSQPVTQWSRGEYAGATRTEDDVSIITGSTGGLRPDEAGATVGTAAELPSPTTTSYITARTDLDVFDLGSCAGPVTVTAAPAPTSPNLDVRLRLLTDSGTQVAVADPPSGRVDNDTASGLGATISQSVTSGAYLVEVDGVGRGTASNGYTDYGSLGAYTLAATGCSAAGLTAPSAPTGLSVEVASPTSLTLRWSPPASTGGSAITGYTVLRDGAGAVPLGAGATAYTFTGLTQGTSYALSVAAVNAVGTSPTAATSGTPAGVPGTVQGISVSRNESDGTLDLTWSAPASTGGSAVTGYTTTVDGGNVVTNADRTRRYTVSAGNHTVTIAAVNAVGTGPTVTLTPPTSVTSLTATPDPAGGSVELRWTAPAGADPAVTTYDVLLDGVRVTTAFAPTTATTVGGLARGRTYDLAVVARNALGSAAPVSRSVTLAPPVTVASAPRIGRALPGARGGVVSARATWAPPTSTGGSPVTGYQVYAYRISGGRVVRTYTTGVLGAGLRAHDLRLPRAGYRFAVRARTSAGWSPLSGRSNTVTAG